MADKRDYYEVLEVERGADASAVKSAYRKLARKYHPDVSSEADAEEKFKEVQEAYDVLSDDRKRAQYDQYGHQAPGGGGFPGGGGGDPFGGFGDIFDIFNAFGGGGGRTGGPQRGADLRYNMQITLEEAFAGVEKTIRIPRTETCDTCTGSGAAPGTKTETCPVCSGAGQVRRMQRTILGTMQTIVTCDRCSGRGQIIPNPCPTCKGRGTVQKQREIKVKVPAGVDDDMQMPLRGEGEAGTLGGPSGDLYIFFQLKEHPIFERNGLDLFTEIPISFTQAALGDEISVPVIGEEKGHTLVTVPEGTQTSETFLVRGKGMPDVHSKNRKGDLHVIVRVQTPTKLTDDERMLLRHLGDLRGEKASDGSSKSHKGLFDQVKNLFTGHHDDKEK